MKTSNRILLTTILTATIAVQAVQGETVAEREARLGWWREARLGLFIHWGPVSLTGKEISWSRANSNPKCPNQGPTPVAVYDELYRQFNPTNFDAVQWAAVAKAAGMKYVVLTAKHCDGFLLWHSQADAYNIGASPFQRDVCSELATAVRGQGLKIGWYFSPMDWRDPDFRTERNPAFIGRMQAEVRELLQKHGRINLLWFDWDAREPVYDQAATYRIVRTLQPKIVVNNRLDLGVGNNDNQILSTNADYYTPEQRIGRYDETQPWETCMTLGTQWSWKPDDQIKSSAECIRTLALCAGGDGNLLLNVGPMPDGRIEPRQVTVLQQLGAWLNTHGESIYGTRGGPWKPMPSLASTRKGRTIYLHVLRWNGESVELPAITPKVISASLLGGGKAQVSTTGGKLVVTVPPAERAAADTVVKLELDSSAMTLPAL